MPIHRERYRRREGAADIQGRAWLVICRQGLRNLGKKRTFLYLMLAAWLPCVVRAVQLYVAANFPQATFLAVSTSTFRAFLDQQELFVFFITVYAGSGLIADDVRSNALPLYLSRPVTRMQYAAGKLAVLMSALALVTWVPAMVLLLLQPMFAGNPSFIQHNLFLIPAIAMVSLIEIVVYAFTMVALSSLSKSRWFVGVMYAGAAFFTQALFGVTRVATLSTKFAWLSLYGNVGQVGDLAFRLPPRYDAPPALSVVMLAVLVSAAAMVLNRRIRAIEVVK